MDFNDFIKGKMYVGLCGFSRAHFSNKLWNGSTMWLKYAFWLRNPTKQQYSELDQLMSFINLFNEYLSIAYYVLSYVLCIGETVNKKKAMSDSLNLTFTIHFYFG